MAVDFPDLEFTTHNQEAHKANTKLASELKASIENKLIKIGIWNFWNTPNLANDSARTQWQYMMKLPALSIAVASKQCKQGWMRSAQESAEKLSEEMQLVTWRAAASRLFTVADPLSLAGEGHQASLQLPHEVTQSNASSSAVAVANPSGQALMCAAVLATSVPLIEVRDEEMDGKAASLSVYGEPSTYIHTFCRHTVYLSLVCIYIYPISSCAMQHKKTKSFRGLEAVSIRCVCRPTGSKPSSSQA